MPTPTKGKRLGGSPAHQRLILANLATSLFEHGRITTTEAKARRLRPFAERLVTKAKHDVLHNRRQVLKVIHDKGVVHALFTEIGPGYATRPGGYTRITKIGPRKGDNAPMAVIELVESKDFATTTTAAKPATAEPVVQETPAPETPTTETPDVEGPTAEEPGTDGAPYGADSAAALEDGSAPDGFEIKGNENSKKYHTSESPWYDKTDAEVWFRTEEAAQAAGFDKAGEPADS